MRWTLVALGVNVTRISRGSGSLAPQEPNRIVVEMTRRADRNEVHAKPGNTNLFDGVNSS